MNIEIRSVQQNGSMSRHQCLDGAHTHENDGSNSRARTTRDTHKFDLLQERKYT